ncbi:hypothetical protein TEA_026327 [Camellia sinensis var. sinensis]|uniref:ACT domain-containing protein ACR n=1 Tax=Camellia sinensis var. sinensis TaxID=542762 RepID=A0A4S4ERC1_CAMSN|nr:hypothetical protein TEA_026327 [Camellia sinensis var. sinensis]
MAVAMASGSTTLGLHTNLRTLEKQPFSRAGLPSAFLGFDSVRRLCISPKGRLSSSVTTIIPRASSATAVEDGSYQETDTIPTPKVIIDQDTDPDATVVEITFGDRLGALLDTMNALKNLGLNVVKANVYLDSSGKHTKFAITKANTGRKVDDPELLEAIRLTIINNLLEYHPESSAQLAMGAAFGIEQPTEKVDVDIATRINVYDDGPDRSLLYVETADRPGLLVDIVTIITDISIAVESGEFDTEGKSPHQAPPTGSSLAQELAKLSQWALITKVVKIGILSSIGERVWWIGLRIVIANSLRYFLRRPTTEESSF